MTENGSETPLRKKFLNQRTKATETKRSQTTACEQKPQARKRILVQTPFSNSALKLQ